MREGWVEVELKDVCGIHDNLRKPVNSSERNIRIQGKKITELYPYYGATGQVGYIDDYLTDGEFVLLGEDGAPFHDYTKNVAYIIKGKTWVNNHAHILSFFFNNKFLCYYLNQFNYHGFVSGTTRLKLTQSSLKRIPVKVAPLQEQRAIVAKIEQLFSELDNGIANLKAAKEKLEIYRQAVLKKAFEGELTREWRTEQVVSSELPFVYLQNIADVATGATPNKANSAYWNKGVIPWITSGALNNLYVSEASDFITEKGLKETNCKIFPRETLLIAMYGEGKTRGKCSELNLGAATNQAIAAILIKKQFKQSKKYLKWFFVKNYNDIRMLSSGGVQPNLNITKIKETRIPFPDPQEQTQIVQAIETRLSLCDNILANIDEGLEKAEALRQSILKKAFEGRLLSETELEACRREPDWEPAEKLLEQIKKSKKEDA